MVHFRQLVSAFDIAAFVFVNGALLPKHGSLLSGSALDLYRFLFVFVAPMSAIFFANWPTLSVPPVNPTNLNLWRV